jgi:acetyl-CoA carboxylase carboxyltransferase component
LEGAVRLGFKKELEAEQDPVARDQLFEQLVARAYELGKAAEAASYLEIDAVIDPVDTRRTVLRALAAAHSTR